MEQTVEITLFIFCCVFGGGVCLGALLGYFTGYCSALIDNEDKKEK
jgi:ABC-type dipeptide/oligopeptide/nickel transport system permease subunit